MKFYCFVVIAMVLRIIPVAAQQNGSNIQVESTRQIRGAAKSTSGRPEALSFDQAIQLAIENNLETLLARERRNEARLLVEGQRVWWKIGLVYLLLASQVVSLMVGWIVIAYIIKCFFGINLMSQTSPLHFIYEALFT